MLNPLVYTTFDARSILWGPLVVLALVQTKLWAGHMALVNVYCDIVYCVGMGPFNRRGRSECQNIIIHVL